MRPAGRRSSRSLPRAVHLALIPALLTLPAAGCGHRIPGFGPSRDGVILVRHTEPRPQEIRVNGEPAGIAQPGGISCFRGVATGTVRLEARPLGAAGAADSLTRATRITLPPEQPLLWDIDHDQVLSGRAHAGLCAREADAEDPPD